jgi:hypothetical protein
MPEMISLPKEGNAFDANSLNDRFDAGRALVNGLPTYAKRPHGLRHLHLPALCPVLAPSHQKVTGAAGTHTYTSGNYTEISDGATPLRIDFSSSIVLGQTSPDYLKALRIQFWVNVVSINTIAATSTPINAAHLAAFILQWKDSGGTWHDIKKSERPLSQDNASGHGNFLTTEDIRWAAPIVATLTADDTSNGSIVSIRAAVKWASATGATWTNRSITLKEGAISFLAFHAG